jgi:DNA replication protein DnaC
MWSSTFIDDFGMKKLGGNAAEDLLEVFVRRHETASTLITTNRPMRVPEILIALFPVILITFLPGILAA